MYLVKFKCVFLLRKYENQNRIITFQGKPDIRRKHKNHRDINYTEFLRITKIWQTKLLLQADIGRI